MMEGRRMNTDVKRYHFRFYGHVQGVGFRYTAKYLAGHLSLTGYVRNEYDGSVTVELQGQQWQIDDWLQRIHEDRYIRIEETELKELPIDEDDRSFRVAY